MTRPSVRNGLAKTNELSGGWISPQELVEPVADVLVRHGRVVVGAELLVNAVGQLFIAGALLVPGASIAISRPDDALPLLMNGLLVIPLMTLVFFLAGAVAVISLAARHDRPVTVFAVLSLTCRRGRGLLISGALTGVVLAALWAWPASFLNGYERVAPGLPGSPEPSIMLITYCLFLGLGTCYVTARLSFAGSVAFLTEHTGLDVLSSTWQMTGPYTLSLLLTLIPSFAVALAVFGATMSVLHQMNVPAGINDIISMLAGSLVPVVPLVAASEMCCAVTSDAGQAPPAWLDLLSALEKVEPPARTQTPAAPIKPYVRPTPTKAAAEPATPIKPEVRVMPVEKATWERPIVIDTEAPIEANQVTEKAPDATAKPLPALQAEPGDPAAQQQAPVSPHRLEEHLPARDARLGTWLNKEDPVVAPSDRSLASDWARVVNEGQEWLRQASADRRLAPVDRRQASGERREPPPPVDRRQRSDDRRQHTE